jgi:shikimate kinase
VWLRADPQLLIRRVGTGRGRPLLDDDPAANLLELYEARRPLYEAVAQITVDVDNRSARQVVDDLLADDRLATAGVRSGGER